MQDKNSHSYTRGIAAVATAASCLLPVLTAQAYDPIEITGSFGGTGGLESLSEDLMTYYTPQDALSFLPDYFEDPTEPGYGSNLPDCSNALLIDCFTNIRNGSWSWDQHYKAWEGYCPDNENRSCGWNSYVIDEIALIKGIPISSIDEYTTVAELMGEETESGTLAACSAAAVAAGKATAKKLKRRGVPKGIARGAGALVGDFTFGACENLIAPEVIVTDCSQVNYWSGMPSDPDCLGLWWRLNLTTPPDLQ